MRTTITLDPDVERLLRDSMQARGVSFKKALNEAVRAGLTRTGRQRPQRFVQKSYSLGAEQHFRWDKALAVAEAIEDEEIARKLSLRK
jgi:hypothetical protein